jgi:predicted protein tyrosine phosphatase
MDAIRPYLLIGGVHDTHDLRLLRYHHVGAMLQLAAEIEHPEIPSLYLPIHDGVPLTSGFLDRAIAYIWEQKAADRATLVACGLGISRSATVVIAARVEIDGDNLLAALQETRALHPETRPHPVLWKSLCDRYGENISYREVIRALPTASSPDAL